MRTTASRDAAAKTAGQRGLLKEQAYTAIIDRIQTGVFAPGSFLSERQLAALLGMSKTPIKAALERLERDGFIVVSPQQGIVVREISIKDIADQFELRLALESYVAKEIAGRISEKSQKAFTVNLRHQAAAAAKGQVTRLVQLDADFHLLMCDVFGNQAILQCLVQHRAKMHRVIYQVMAQGTQRLKDAVREHKAIYVALRSGKSARAVKLIEQHLEYGKRYLLELK